MKLSDLMTAEQALKIIEILENEVENIKNERTL